VPEGQRAEALADAQEIATEAGRSTPSRGDVREARRKYTPVTARKPRKPRETPQDMAAAVVAAAERRTEADGGVVTPPVISGTDASSEAASSPRASSAGSVVMWVRTLALPDSADVRGMTVEDMEAVAHLRMWCAEVLMAYERSHT